MNSKVRRIENRHKRHHEKNELQKEYEAIACGFSDEINQTKTFDPIRHKLAHRYREETESR